MKNILAGSVIEEESCLTLVELCEASNASEEHVISWVIEGVLEPVGDAPEDWQFSGHALKRTRLALSFASNLEVNPPGVALALDLLDQIAVLKARLRRMGMHSFAGSRL
jgi:chaperone modulatory protein CbpM